MSLVLAAYNKSSKYWSSTLNKLAAGVPFNAIPCSLRIHGRDIFALISCLFLLPGFPVLSVTERPALLFRVENYWTITKSCKEPIHLSFLKSLLALIPLIAIVHHRKASCNVACFLKFCYSVTRFGSPNASSWFLPFLAVRMRGRKRVMVG